MRGKLHFLWNAPILIVLGCLVYYYIFASRFLIIAVYFGIICGQVSDLDLSILGQKYHRHYLFHSCIWTAFLWFIAWGIPEVQLIIAFCVLGNGLHLLEDIQINRFSMRGTYTIKTRQTITGKVKGLNGWNSTLWLIINFLISVVLFGITIMLVM